MTPREYTSSRGSAGSPRICCGEAYSGVQEPRSDRANISPRDVPLRDC